MAQNPGTSISFIPKRPLAKSGYPYKRPLSMILTVAVILAFLSIGAYMGLYFYERSIIKSIDDKKQKLIAIHEQLDTEIIREAKMLKKHIDTGKALLSGHTTGSAIFAMLEENTLQSAVISKFSYKTDEKGMRKMNISVETPGFSQAAAFRDMFKSVEEFQSVDISNVSLGQAGDVSFNMDITIDPSLISYSNLIKEKALNAEEGAEPGLNTEVQEGTEDLLPKDLEITS